MTIRELVARFVRLAAGESPPMQDSSPAKCGSNTKVDLAEFTYIDEFTPHAADALLCRFKKEGIRVEIGCDVTPPGDTAVNGGCYAERRTVSIYVHREDLTKSRQILEHA